MEMFEKIVVIYALCGCIAAGHWFANEYDTNGSNGGVGNPAVSGLVAMSWPMYASYVFFNED